MSNTNVRLMSDKNPTAESSMFHLSVRSWLALFVTGTMCYCQIVGVEVKEPFYTAVTLIIGVYFGQNAKTSTTVGENNVKLPLNAPGTTSTVSVESTTVTPAGPKAAGPLQSTPTKPA